jgi:hypothetical protein
MIFVITEYFVHESESFAGAIRRKRVARKRRRRQRTISRYWKENFPERFEVLATVPKHY